MKELNEISKLKGNFSLSFSSKISDLRKAQKVSWPIVTFSQEDFCTFLNSFQQIIGGKIKINFSLYKLAVEFGGGGRGNPDIFQISIEVLFFLTDCFHLGCLKSFEC